MDSCSDGLAVICKNVTLEGWSDPWWPQCARTTLKLKPLHSSEQLVKNDKSEWKEHVTGGCCEFFCLMAPHRTYISSLHFTSWLTFPHLSCLCFMSDTKAFNQQALIYDSSERCNLRFLVEGRKKTGRLSHCQIMRGPASSDQLHPLPLRHPEALAFSTCGEVKRWQNTLTAALLLLLLLLFLLHSVSHQMSLCEGTAGVTEYISRS